MKGNYKLFDSQENIGKIVISMRLNKRIIFVFLILLLNIHSLQAQDKTKNPSFIPIGHLEILCSYSDIDKGRSLWGYDVWGYFSPIIKLSDTLTLIPLYNGEFQRMRQYVSQEEADKKRDEEDSE